MEEKNGHIEKTESTGKGDRKHEITGEGKNE